MPNLDAPRGFFNPWLLMGFTLLSIWSAAGFAVAQTPVATPASKAASIAPIAATGNSAELPAVAIPLDPCRVDVAKFERGIGFIRQNQGNKAADELREKLLPAKIQNTILSDQGYCGLAKYLNDKKLLK